MLEKRRELQDYLLILLLLRKKEIVWWLWWMRHAVFTIISLSKITVQTRGGCSRQVRVYWIWRKIDLFPTFGFTAYKQHGSVFYCQDCQYQVKAGRNPCCQRPSPTWNLNLVILYFPTFNAKRLRQFVIWLHLKRTNLASWTQHLPPYHLHV